MGRTVYHNAVPGVNGALKRKKSPRGMTAGAHATQVA